MSPKHLQSSEFPAGKTPLWTGLKRLFATKRDTNAHPSEREQAVVPVPEGVSLFHITHQKAGSQWIRNILTDAFGHAVVEPLEDSPQVLSRPIQPQSVYPCVYLAKEEFDTVPCPGVSRHIVIIRDLRDTLVSGYFSIRNSHAVLNSRLARLKATLQRLPIEEGLLYLLDMWLANSAYIQRTWLEAGEPCLRFEDCLTDPRGALGRLFRQYWTLEVPDETLDGLIARNSFEQLSGGRKPGAEDSNSHYRKGVPGDWKSHFTPKVKARFKARYNEVLLAAGYERDPQW